MANLIPGLSSFQSEMAGADRDHRAILHCEMVEFQSDRSMTPRLPAREDHCATAIRKRGRGQEMTTLVISAR